MGHRIFGIIKKVLLGSILCFDTEFNIGMSDNNYVTKYVHICTFNEGVSNFQLKEWSRNLNEDLLYCSSKHSKEGDTQLDRLEGDINALKRSKKNISKTNELLTNKIDNLTLMLENQSSMMKEYFGKETGIVKNSNHNTSNGK